jgi:hypothetical protein
MRNTLRAVLTRWLAPLWPATAVGIVLGAALGGLAMQTTSTTTAVASALISVDQPIDPNQLMTGTASAPDSLQSYLAGEITYLTSPGFAAEVGKELNQTKTPDISATQNAQSSIITITATAQDFNEASHVIDAALRTYDDHVLGLSRDRSQTAIDAINSVISGLADQIQQDVAATTQYDAAGNPTPIVTDRQRTLQGRIDQLELQRQSIEVQLQRPAAVQIVQAPTKVSSSRVPPWTLGAVGGGLLGGLVMLALALIWRKRSNAVFSPAALEGYVDNVLLPTVALNAITGLGEPTSAELTIGRLLYAQLTPPRSGRILLIGASVESGAAQVARLLAFAAAEHHDVTLVHLLDGSNDSKGMEKITAAEQVGGPIGDTTTIIDGGSLEAPPALLEVVAHAAQIIIVAMIGRDTTDLIRMTNLLTRASGVPVSGICTKRKSGSRRGKRGSDRPSSKHSRRTVPEPREEELTGLGAYVDGST